MCDRPRVPRGTKSKHAGAASTRASRMRVRATELGHYLVVPSKPVTERPASPLSAYVVVWLADLLATGV